MKANVLKFAKELAGLFAGVKPAFLAREKDRLRAQADREVAAWGKRLADGPAKNDWRVNRPGELVAFLPHTFDRDHKHPWDDLPGSDAPNLGFGSYGDPIPDDVLTERLLNHPLRAEYAKVSSRPNEFHERWAVLTKGFDAGLYVPNYALAEKMAVEYVDQAEQHFVAKQSKKLASACGERPIVKIKGELRLAGIVTGHMVVTVQPRRPALGDDSFRVEMDIITNYRYGHNSANGRLTVYAQFPARYKDVRIGGEVVKKSAGEKWMKDTFATAHRLSE